MRDRRAGAGHSGGEGKRPLVNRLIRCYNDYYLEARRALKNAGISAFALEARLLLACAAGKTEAEFLRDLRLFPSDGFAERAEDFVRRRIEGEPAAYITGRWSFYGLELEITPDVLIPRSDTELIPEAALRFLRGRGPCRVLDLCTGSGCIGLAVAAHSPESHVVLIDKSRAALQLARKNSVSLGLRSRVLCMEGDALAAPPSLLGTFDLLCSNPPYIPTAEIDTLEGSVKDYEPRPALDGGGDGLVFYRSILLLWSACLKPGGQLIFECGEEQSAPIRRMADKSGFLFREAVPDTLGTERVLIFEKAHTNDNR